MIRVGEANTIADAFFPVMVPLLGVGHLIVDGNLRDPRAAALVRSVLLRVVATVPAEQLRVRPVDGVTVGKAFVAFQPLIDAGVIPVPVIDLAGQHALLQEAEAHVRTAHHAASEARLETVPYMIVIGTLPNERHEPQRLAALAHAGPESRLHLVLAGWDTHSSTQPLPVLDHAVRILLDDAGARVEDPPGQRWFSSSGQGLPAPVILDQDPPPELVDSTCRSIADRLRRTSTPAFADVLPAEVWQESAVHGLRTAVGRDENDIIELAFDDNTPHWMRGGRSGSGKTVFQLNLLYGLAARYSPDELALYLLDFKEGVSFTEFTPTDTDPSWLPHARAVGTESDREYGQAVISELVTEMERRADAMKIAGVSKLADLRQAPPQRPAPRIVCVIDEYQVLLAGNDRVARQAVAGLEDLARKGRSYGIHLVLASQTASGIEALYTKQDSIFGQFPLRIALAGAIGVLHMANNAAASLPIGAAIVNNSGGIPGHNQMVRFPNAHAEAPRVAELRHDLWNKRPQDSGPPAVFVGSAEQHVENDPTYAALKPGGRRPLLLGRVS